MMGTTRNGSESSSLGRAQAILKPLLPLNVEAYLFSPVRGEEERNAKRRQERRSPMTPSQEKRKRKSGAAVVGVFLRDAGPDSAHNKEHNEPTRSVPGFLVAYSATQRLMMGLPWAAADQKSEEAEVIKALVHYHLFDREDFGACTRG